MSARENRKRKARARRRMGEWYVRTLHVRRAWLIERRLRKATHGFNLQNLVFPKHGLLEMGDV